MKNNKIYKELCEKYTDEEIAESFIFPSKMTPEERKELADFLKKIKNDNEK